MKRSRKSAPCRVVLIRHAHAEGQGRFLGHLDPPLSATGLRQLPSLTRKLRAHTFDAVYCSDLSRALTTASAIARPHHLIPSVRRQLREMDFGRWDGLTWDEVAERFPRSAARWLSGPSRPRVPGGEPFTRFKARALSEITRIVSANRGRCVAIVTHAGVARVALAVALGVSDRHLFRIAQPPGAVNVIDYFGGDVIVRSINA